MYSLLTLTLLALPFPNLVNAADFPACSNNPYKALLPLSNYAPAQSYCSKNYPLPTKTVTSTVTNLVVTYLPAPNKRTLIPRATPTNASQSWSSVLAGAQSIIKTVCSCIETRATKTKTVTTTSTETRAPLCTNKVTTGPSAGCKYAVSCFAELNLNGCATLQPPIQGGNYRSVYDCVRTCDATAGCVAVNYVPRELYCQLAISTNGYYCAASAGAYYPVADIAILQGGSCGKMTAQPSP